MDYHFSSERLAELSRAYQTLAAEMDIPYLEVLVPMAQNDAWQNSFTQDDGVHPAGDGYALIAKKFPAGPRGEPGWSDCENRKHLLKERLAP